MVVIDCDDFYRVVKVTLTLKKLSVMNYNTEWFRGSAWLERRSYMTHQRLVGE